MATKRVENPKKAFQALKDCVKLRHQTKNGWTCSGLKLTKTDHCIHTNQNSVYAGNGKQLLL